MKKKLADIEICKRFLKAFDVVCAEKDMKADELARTIGTTGVYISQLRKSTKPHIRQDIIAQLCDAYKISPAYVLLGEGETRELPYNIVEAIKRIEHDQTKTISWLLEGLFELRPNSRRTIDELIALVKRRNN